MIDFGLLPPEVNSARMYAGVGAGPLLATAAAWDATSVGLGECAACYALTVTGLAAVWTGPSALAMTQAASRYASWMTLTAAHAETTANQARAAAAAAFEAAFMATVPPEVVAANRALLAMLVATNIMGVNTPAIMATEALYLEYWAQDAAAMYEYAAASAAATRLPQFTAAPQIATGAAAQAAAVSHAAATPPGTVQGILSGLLGGQTLTGFIGQTFQSLVSSGVLIEGPLGLLSLFTVLWGVSSPNSAISKVLNNPTIVTPEVVVPPSMPAPTAGAAPSTSIRVAIGNGNRIGLLRVPPDWARPVPSPSPVTPLPAAPPTNEAFPMPMPLPMGAPRGGTPMKQEKPQPEYGIPVRFIPRPPAGG